jgi:hypothetical protein
MILKRIFLNSNLSLFVISFFALTLASFDSKADFRKDEANIYPSGTPTADTLKSSEWYLAPIPWGWLAYGLTDKLTIAWDYPATILGLPSGLVRYQLPGSSKNMGWALDLYGISWGSKTFEQKRAKEFIVDYRGGQYWIHLNWSLRIFDWLRLNTYGGATHTDYHKFRPNETAQFQEKLYEDAWSPDYGASLEFDISSWLKFHVNSTVGNTFLYVDQIVYKKLAAGTFQLAPFSSQATGILKNLRLELSAMYVEIPDAQYKYTLPLPLFPYLYWQWE